MKCKLVRMVIRAGITRLALCLLLFGGCANLPATSTSPHPAAASTPQTTGTVERSTTGGSCVAATCAAQSVSVFVEPDAGTAPVLQAIHSATRSIWIEVYLFTDRTVIHALESAAAHGVDVRVLLEAHPYGGGDVQAARLLEELQAAGVHAEPASPAFTYTHAKLMLIDQATAYIMTSNLTVSGLGGTFSYADRDYGVIDTNSLDVSTLASIFTADWNRTNASAADQRLVISPINARSALDALLASAQTSLDVEDEEMYDRASEDALIAAARRGVSVTVVLPQPSAGASPSPDVERLLHGGVRVRYLRAPYLHAKLVIVDGRLAFVGSENFSATSLDRNREVGILLSNPAALVMLKTAYAHDEATATAA